jgi:hypothetical protein
VSVGAHLHASVHTYVLPGRPPLLQRRASRLPRGQRCSHSCPRNKPQLPLAIKGLITCEQFNAHKMPAVCTGKPQLLLSGGEEGALQPICRLCECKQLGLQLHSCTAVLV